MKKQIKTKSSTLCLAAVLLFFSVPSPALSVNEKDFNAIYLTANKFFQEKNYAKALEYYDKAIHEPLKKMDKENVGLCLIGQGECHRALKNYPLARAEFSATYQEYKQLFGESDPRTHDVLQRLQSLPEPVIDKAKLGILFSVAKGATISPNIFFSMVKLEVDPSSSSSKSISGTVKNIGTKNYHVFDLEFRVKGSFASSDSGRETSVSITDIAPGEERTFKAPVRSDENYFELIYSKAYPRGTLTSDPE